MKKSNGLDPYATPFSHMPTEHLEERVKAYGLYVKHLESIITDYKAFINDYENELEHRKEV